MANASCEAWKVNGTVMEPLEVLMFWLSTTCGALSGYWSGIRSTTTLTLPLLVSQGTEENPLYVTDAAPVYPLSSPMMATDRFAELSSAAEIAVLPTWPDVETRDPVMSA